MKANHHPILVSSIFCMLFVLVYSSVFQFDQRAKTQQFEKQLTFPDKLEREFGKVLQKTNTLHVKIRKIGF